MEATLPPATAGGGVDLGAQLADAKEQVKELTSQLAAEREERKRAEALKDHWKIRSMSTTVEKKEPRILSPILRTSNKWYEVTWLLAHEPIRQAVEELKSVFGNELIFDPVKDPWKLKHFFLYLADTFFVYMERHYANVDLRYLPWVAERAPQVASAKARFEHAHASIMAKLQGIKASATDFHAFNSAPADERILHVHSSMAKLREDVLDLCEQLQATMDDEERKVPPLVAEHYTEEEEAAQLQVIAMTGIGEAHIELPMMVCGMEAWATPEQREALLSKKLSVTARWTLETYWVPAFKGRNLFYLTSLALDAEVQPEHTLPLMNTYWLSLAVPVFFACNIS